MVDNTASMTTKDLDRMLGDLKQEIAVESKKHTVVPETSALFKVDTSQPHESAPTACKNYEAVSYQVMQSLMYCIRDTGCARLGHTIQEALSDTDLDYRAVVSTVNCIGSAKEKDYQAILKPWTPFPRNLYDRYMALQRKTSEYEEALHRVLTRLAGVGLQNKTQHGTLHEVITTLSKIVSRRMAIVRDTLKVKRDAYTINAKTRASVLTNLMLAVSEILAAFEKDVADIVSQHKDYVAKFQAARAGRREASGCGHVRKVQRAAEDYKAWLKVLEGVIPSALAMTSEASVFFINNSDVYEDCGKQCLETMAIHLERVKGALNMAADSGIANNGSRFDVAREKKNLEQEVEDLSKRIKVVKNTVEGIRKALAFIDKQRVDYWSGTTRDVMVLEQLESNEQRLQDKRGDLTLQLDRLESDHSRLQSRLQAMGVREKPFEIEDTLVQVAGWEERIANLQRRTETNYAKTSGSREKETQLLAVINHETIRSLGNLYRQAVNRVNGCGVAIGKRGFTVVTSHTKSAATTMHTLQMEDSNAAASANVYESRLAVDATAAPLIQRFNNDFATWREVKFDAQCYYLMSEAIKSSKELVAAYSEWKGKFEE